MSPTLVFSVITGYFLVLMLISFITSRKSDTASFFTANRKSPWFLVAFGMIGASLSGVTFISVPGDVGNTGFAYFQMVMGYLVGYFIIATVLLPLYYKLNLVSIYTYLKQRFGRMAYLTGSGFFLLSRTIGASFRLFLVAGVLQIAFFNALNVPFAVTVLVTISLIWVYTFRSGIKTIVWTDTLQTFFMITAIIITIYIIKDKMGFAMAELINEVRISDKSDIFVSDWKSGINFFKQFFAGAFIAIAMTGLDQDMMQKNLTCKNIKDAQKNMLWFSLSLLPVNLLFLFLGAVLFIFANEVGIEFFSDPEGKLLFIFDGIHYNTDYLFPVLALNYSGLLAGIVFLLGIIAAAFSSADSALTSLTTAFSIDFLNLDINCQDNQIRKVKRRVHLMFSALIFTVIVLFKYLNNENVITAVFRVAGYTYGPLLGLFAFGLFTKYKTKDKFIPVIAVLSPVICFVLSYYSEIILNGYKMGFELLILNGLITFLGLLIFREKRKQV